MDFLCFLYILTVFLPLVSADPTPPPWTSTPIFAPCLPLAVRSPSLNTWRPQGHGAGSVSDASPYTWNGTNFPIGWYVGIRIDGTTYEFLGGQNPSQIGAIVANQTSIELTSTRTAVTLEAGPVNATLTFVNPITPNDIVRQSIPFSYLAVDVRTTDGNAHDIQVYSEIDPGWITGDSTQQLNWTAVDDGTAIVLKTQFVSPQPFVTIGDRAQDASVYYSMQKQSAQTWQIGHYLDLRKAFNDTGVLNNTADPDFRAPNTNEPGFAITVDLGQITSTTGSLVWAIGNIRDPVIKTLTAAGTSELRRSYFWTNFTSDIAVAEFFLADYPNALAASKDFDAQLQANATQISSNYADLLLLSVVQTFGSLDITAGLDSSGNLNASDVKVYMNSFDPVNSPAQVNVVDALFSAAPLFITLNPDFLKYLLLPLLDSPSQTTPYAIHDIGLTYPVATTPGESSENFAIEESANMLILALSHAQATGDQSLLMGYYTLFQKWADYLVDNSLQPGTQFTYDELSIENQSNLALKGIIAIRAMSVISQLKNDSNSTSTYTNASESLLNQWQTQAISTSDGHILSSYGQQSSWALIYNLYADKLLRLNFIDETVYEKQTSYYKQLASPNTPFGIPFDSSQPLVTRTDWLMLTAATVTDNTTRDQFITWIHNYVTALQDNTPFTLQYDPTTGSRNQSTGAGINSPAQGSMFAFLALMASAQIAPSSGNQDSPGSAGSSSSNVGAIVGGVLGGLAAIGAVLGVFLFQRHRTRKHLLEVRNPNLLSPRSSYLAYSIHPFSSLDPEDPDDPNKPLGHAEMSQSSEDSLSVAYTDSPNVATAVSTVGIASNISTAGDTSILLSPTTRYPATVSNPSDVPRSSDRDSEQLTQVLMAKQTLLQQELRTRVDELQRQMESIRETRDNPLPLEGIGAAPPYSESERFSAS